MGLNVPPTTVGPSVGTAVALVGDDDGPNVLVDGAFEGGSVGGVTVGDLVGDFVVVVGELDGAFVVPLRVGLLVGVAVLSVGDRVGGGHDPV